MPSHERYLADLVRAWAAGSTQPVPPPRDLDRENFLRRFAVEAAAPTLASVLHPDALPPGDWDRCHKALTLARQRTTWLLLELERVLPALAEAGCRPIVLKGAPLALGVYPRPEDRWFIDLDVLLTRAELPVAYTALERLGYRFSETYCSPQYYENHHFHRILRSAQGVYLEAHWAVTLPASAYSFDLEALRRDATTIPLGRTSVLAPSYLDQVLHGVLQSIAGGFTDLRRVLDLHLLDGRLSDFERERLAERALAHNLATGVWLQYRLREELAGVAIPAPIAESCAPTPRVRLLLENLDVPGGCLARRARQSGGLRTAPAPALPAGEVPRAGGPALPGARHERPSGNSVFARRNCAIPCPGSGSCWSGPVSPPGCSNTAPARGSGRWRGGSQVRLGASLTSSDSSVRSAYWKPACTEQAPTCPPRSSAR